MQALNHAMMNKFTTISSSMQTQLHYVQTCRHQTPIVDAALKHAGIKCYNIQTCCNNQTCRCQMPIVDAALKHAGIKWCKCMLTGVKFRVTSKLRSWESPPPTSGDDISTPRVQKSKLPMILRDLALPNHLMGTCQGTDTSEVHTDGNSKPLMVLRDLRCLITTCEPARMQV
jgi:hypothetical protein